MSSGIMGNNISEKYKFQWIAPERTGSRKLSEILTYYGFTWNGEKVFNYGTYKYSHRTDQNNYQDYKVICSARNPYSRVLSLFKNFYQKTQEKNKETFKNYLKYDLPQGQMYNMVVNPILTNRPDYIIRLEHMVDDLLKLPFILDVLTERQVRLLTEHGKPIDEWESFYDEESKDIIRNLIPTHFEYFGYEK
jgi:hypothetical protein